MISQIHREFGACGVDIRTYSPLTLAYVGDAVFEIIVRTLVVEKGQRAANTLHKHTTQIVCAQTQARMAEALYDRMTEKEQDTYRRAKNTKLNSSAKNASLSDYRKATGFEAVCGYLFLTDDVPRILELVRKALDILGIEL
ncbi:MAG: ribonuclease III [Roseburia sp.]|nr:ribonuclease III [Roseburia sp.]